MYVKNSYVLYIIFARHQWVPSSGETNISDIEIKLNLYWKYYNGTNINLWCQKVNLSKYEDVMKVIRRYKGTSSTYIRLQMFMCYKYT